MSEQTNGSAVDAQLFDAVKSGDVDRVASLLNEHPDRLNARNKPYEWTLLHGAAHTGNLAIVDLLLRRGLDANAREEGDNTCAMHWAAAAGHVDVVRRLADAGGDVVGHGDDHEMDVIGWATCWEGTDDDAHHAIVDLLLDRGAHHHIYSAISMNLGDEVRRIVATDPGALNQRMSRNEANQTPLQFAVRRKRPGMVALLLELGADPMANDADGFSAPMYATSSGVDRPLLEAIFALTEAEIRSADRGHRPATGVAVDLIASVALSRLDAASRLLRDTPALLDGHGVLHVLAKRGDTTGVRWLLEQGADPNVQWAHWSAVVTPLHLASWLGHADVVRALLDAGADPSIRDSQFDADAIGWAEHGGHDDIVRTLTARSRK